MAFQSSQQYATVNDLHHIFHFAILNSYSTYMPLYTHTLKHQKRIVCAII